MLAVVAVGLEFAARGQRRRFDAVLGTESATCGEVAALFAAVEAEAGAGSLRRMVEVRADAVAAGTAPLSGKAAAWYRSVITEESLEWEDTNSTTATTKVVGGSSHAPVRPDRRLVERSQVLEEHRSTGLLTVQDGTGKVAVDLGGRDVEHALQVLDRLERDPRHRAGRPGRVGLHHNEWIVAPGTPLTVIGEARLQGGAVVITDPDGKAPLLVSTRTGDELASSAKGRSTALRGGAIGLGALGLVLVVVGLVA